MRSGKAGTIALAALAAVAVVALPASAQNAQNAKVKVTITSVVKAPPSITGHVISKQLFCKKKTKVTVSALAPQPHTLGVVKTNDSGKWFFEGGLQGATQIQAKSQFKSSGPLVCPKTKSAPMNVPG